MRGMQSLLAGLGLGMAAMYFSDPRMGRRRRAVLRDKMIRSGNVTRRALDTGIRDLGHRLRGIACEGRALLHQNSPVSDEVLAARIRSRIGRVISHPHAVHVDCDQGICTLTGPILKDEVSPLISCVNGVAGVQQVECDLDSHETRGSFSSLQGGIQHGGERLELMQRNWAPGTRLAMGALGGALTIGAAPRRDLPGAGMVLLGLGLVARSLTNMDFGRLTGLNGSRRGIDIQKSFEITAPVEKVYGFWTRFENFPRFMSHLNEVIELGGGRSRWTAVGPAGIPISWDAVITRDEPNERICWKSVDGSIVENAGQIRFKRTDDGRTRVHIQMTYNPPAGIAGHAIARLFAVDPKSSMDADLVRLKSLFEIGKTHAHGNLVTSDDLSLQQSQTVGAF